VWLVSSVVTTAMVISKGFVYPVDWSYVIVGLYWFMVVEVSYLLLGLSSGSVV